MRCIAIFTASLVGFFLGPLILASAQVARESRAAPPASTSEATRLEVSRDTWVSEVGQEADGNNGGAGAAEAQEHPGDDADRRQSGGIVPKRKVPA